MKLYVPGIGDELRLTVDWTFPLHDEHRNETLMEYLNDPRHNPDDAYSRRYNKKDPLPATIPAGAVLKVDRIYIRKGLDDFSSITFFWKDARTPGGFREEDDWKTYDRTIGKCTAKKTVKIARRPVRFWVKLDDANKIEFEPA